MRQSISHHHPTAIANSDRALPAATAADSDTGGMIAWGTGAVGLVAIVLGALVLIARRRGGVAG